MTLSGQHVAILGAGRSGRAAAALALREGARVSAWDASGIDAFAGIPEGVEIHPDADIADGHALVCDLLVLSPGIETDGPFASAFAAGAGEVIGEVELASRHYHGTVIGITGTNGKTTTTALVGRILEQAGMGGTPCGNFGTPFAEVVMRDDPPRAVALELSSFQLESIRTLRPHVAVWLNFAPDHMDRYPNIAAYHAAKCRIFLNQQSDDVAVVRSGEGLPPLQARVTTFSTTDPEADWFSDGHDIRHHGVTVASLGRDTALRGLHNAENAMAAMAACGALGIAPEVMCGALQGFVPPLHRCELVRTLDGVEYLNDSKATNLHALESALRSQTRPVVLIAGGKDKGLDYSPVLPLLREKVLAAVTFGQISRPLAAVFANAVQTEAVATLDEAVQVARTLAPAGSCVLLSPGTSSFDQFAGYEQRGDSFRDLVHQLH
jgi:UDP-N-acetylmuramoylalanine--D-glutamate ligase